MKAILKGIDLNSVVGFEEFVPDNYEVFSIWITAEIGNESEGADLFQIQVCTPGYLQEQVSTENAVWGRHMLIVDHYHPPTIRKKIEAYLDHCTGSDWKEIAKLVARMASWEFEDYQPFTGR